MKKPKTIKGLMKHLRDNGVNINGSKQKIQLTNQGYYHSYKGYRFFKNSSRRLPITDYEQINLTFIYDSKLKSILYDKLMFIETALKNICLNIIATELDSDRLDVLYEKGVYSYRNSPSLWNTNKKREAQKKLLKVQGKIHSEISKNYDKNPKIKHFYDSQDHDYIPLWAIFEILTMGEFGHLLEILTFNIKDKISAKLCINSAYNTNRELVQNYVMLLKCLRNSVAHNDIVYDNRFKNYDEPNGAHTFLKNEIGLPYVNFKDIIDFIALIVFFLKKLSVSKTEIKAFVKMFEEATEEYCRNMDLSITSITINNNWRMRIQIIKKYI